MLILWLLRCEKVEQICTDANSCYDVAFKALGIPEAHIITKAETHLILIYNDIWLHLN